MKIRIPSLLFLYFGLALIGISGFFFTLLLEQPIGFYAFIVAAALGGFGVAANIFYVKKRNKQLVCPTGSNCNVVVNSRYAKFFGIPLEYMGMLYYFIIIISYLSLIFIPGALTGTPLVTVMLLTMGAGLFSCYLLFVQAFLLRAWCIWCILSALLSLTIFTISLVSLEIAISFLANVENIIQMVRFLGFSLGIGAATSAVFLFLRFLKDLNIDEREFNVLNGIFEVVWIGFGLVMINQFALYVIHAEMLVHSGVFIMQTLALFVAAFAGAILMIIYAPFLVFMPFQKSDINRSSFGTLRLPTIVTGTVALVSWYFAFGMNFIQETDFFTLFIVYIAAMVVLVGLSVFWEKRLVGKNSTSTDAGNIQSN